MNSSLLFSQNNEYFEDDSYDDEYYEENEYDDSEYINMLLFDVGYGFNDLGLSLGLGYRYWMFGAVIGIAGIANDIPDYSRDIMPIGSEVYGIEKYPALAISLDFNIYFDFLKPIDLFATVGFYSQSDSLLVNTSNGYYYDTREGSKVESSSGVGFGAGAQYPVSEYLGIGLAIHSRRGIYGQLNYRW